MVDLLFLPLPFAARRAHWRHPGRGRPCFLFFVATRHWGRTEEEGRV